MSKILVIRYGTIGDCVFASAFYRELRHAEKNSKIDILVDELSAETMLFCPYIDEIHLIQGKYKSFFYYIKLFKKYDTIYFLKNDRFFTKIAKLANIKNRIGFNIKRNKFLTIKAPYNEDRHEIDCYLDLLKMSGIQVLNSNTEIWCSTDSKEKIKKLYNFKRHKNILIHAYSRFDGKNWLDEYWQDIIKYLRKEYDAQIFLCGSLKDAPKYKKLLNGIEDSSIINVSGKLSVSDNIALVQNMDLVIGIDSCMVHIAAASNIPSILLHGPTSLLRWKPRNENCSIISGNFVCSPCLLQSNSNKLCKHKTPRCMQYLIPDRIKQVIKSKLSLPTHYS